MKTWTIGEADGGARLDAWLARQPEIGSRGRARSAIERGKVFLNGEGQDFADAATRLSPGDQVGYWEDRPGSARTPARDVVSARAALRIVHEDAAILAVDKQPGWLVEPLPGEEGSEVTLLDLLRDHLRAARRRPFVVHRIDRDTSGLVLFALTPAARDDLKRQFERRTPERIYLAVVHGLVVPASGTWRDHLVWDTERLIQRRAHIHEERAREAVARYRVLEQHEGGAVVEVSLVTGKRNQIRVQAGLRGYPLVGERLYTYGRQGEPGPRLELGRQALHAATLAFRHPEDHRPVQLDAPLPDDLRNLIDRLRAGS
ncbi:MAG TPA: RluA family pseudouridine synthase [Vicinamibacterales bacterium]|nr:RluA family pseudouridine synthase [Acidobacteriota bacterium]HOC17002.1 RluA family pseudouridine synthase [Vicinamibacterales bacterium]